MSEEVSVTQDELRALYDFDHESNLVREALRVATANPVALLRFMGRYASWNGWFGAGVAGLAAKIGRSRHLFVDTAESVQDFADRGVLVASYFFDAARDEFDDRDTAHRDTHRCLAQATLKGMAQFFAKAAPPLELNEVWNHPLWLDALSARVAIGYGHGSPDTLPAIFRAIGYHLGSEILADREFSTIDEQLRSDQAELVSHLRDNRIEIAGQEHVAYQWLAIHSGHGGGAEADHFAWATEGAHRALLYVPAKDRVELRHQLHLGFMDFARDHREFFEHVNS